MVRSDLILPLLRVFLLFGTAVVCLFVLERRSKLLSNFWREKSHPLNLAIARIVIMSVLISRTTLNYLLSYSRLHPALIVPPLGWAHIAAHIPRNPALLTVTYVVFIFFGVLAIVGLYGRLSCLLTSLAGFYLLTIPQLFGKINHDHHLILFGIILAASPCCDTLSLDAIRDARRLALQGTRTQKLRASLDYGQPLKVMMILLGLIYFFPGAWKLCRVGLQWFSADNMRWTIAAKLLELGRFTPFQQWVIAHSYVLVAGAFFTIVFELGFAFSTLSPRTRPFAAVCGIAFHNLTGFLMNIRFVTIQACYVILIDWHRVFVWLAAKRAMKPAYVVSSGGSSELAFLNMISRFDWLDQVVFETEPCRAGGTLSPSADTDSLVVIEDGRQVAAYEVRSSLMRRIAVLWPVYWLLSARQARGSVHHVLSAGSRSCRDGTEAVIRIRGAAFEHRRSTFFRPLAAIFVFGMILAGLSHSVDAWPIACYPTFDHVQTGIFNELSISAVDGQGRVYNQDLSFDRKIEASLSPERYEAMVGYMLRDDVPLSSEKAASLINLWRQTYGYPSFKEVTLYANTYAFDSNGRRGPLIRNRELIRLQ